jgi:hypothetical protein
LALASLTGSDRSIGIVRLRTKNHGVFFYLLTHVYSMCEKELLMMQSQSQDFGIFVHFQLPNYEKVFVGMQLVCMYGCASP